MKLLCLKIQEQTETRGLHAVFSEWSVHCDLTTNQMQVSTITPPSHHRPISSYCQCQYTHCSKKTMGFLTSRESSRCSLFYSVLNVKEKLSKNFLGDFLRAERSIKFPWISRLFSIKFSYQTKCWIHGKKIGFSCRSQNVTKYS